MANSDRSSVCWRLPLFTIGPRGDDCSIVVAVHDDESYFLLFTERRLAEDYAAAMRAADPDKDAAPIEFARREALFEVLFDVRASLSGLIANSPFRPESFESLEVDDVLEMLGSKPAA